MYGIKMDGLRVLETKQVNCLFLSKEEAEEFAERRRNDISEVIVEFVDGRRKLKIVTSKRHNWEVCKCVAK